MMMVADEARHSVEVDRVRLMVTVTASGFFTVEAAHEATMALRRAVQSLGRDVGRHATLYDLTGMAPVPAEAVELMRMGFANPVYRPIWARKVAWVTPSQLLRRQIDRVREARPDMRIFDTRDAAINWLVEP